MDDSHQLSECSVSVHHLPVPAVLLPIYLDSDIYIEPGEVNGEGAKGETFTGLQKGHLMCFHLCLSKEAASMEKPLFEIIVAIGSLDFYNFSRAEWFSAFEPDSEDSSNTRPGWYLPNLPATVLKQDFLLPLLENHSQEVKEELSFCSKYSRVHSYPQNLP